MIRHPQEKQTKSSDNDKNNVISLPYINGLSNVLSRINNKYNTKTVFKTQNKSNGKIVKKGKDKIGKEDNQGLVYEIECKDCNSVYIGETNEKVKN